MAFPIKRVGAGAMAHSTSAPAPALPSGLIDNDFMILVVVAPNTSIIATPTNWNELGSQVPVDNSGTNNDLRVALFYRFYQAGDSGPSVADTGDNTSAQVFALRGVKLSGFLDDTAPGASTTGSVGARTAAQFSQQTTDTANEFIFFAMCSGLDATGENATWSQPGTNPWSNFSKWTDDGSSDGVGTAITTATGERAASGANVSPSATVTFTSSVRDAVGLGVGLRPASQNDSAITGAVGGFGGAAVVTLAATIGHSISGAVGAIGGSATVVQTLQSAIDDVLGAFNGSATVVLPQQINIAGELGAFSGSIEIAQINDVLIDGVLGAFSGSAVVELVALEITIDGTGQGFSGSALVDVQTPQQHLLLVGSLGIFSGDAAVDAGLSPVKIPEDDDYVITVATVDRVMAVPSVDRVLEVPFVDRIITRG